MRLVKQQLAALSRPAAPAPDKPSDKKGLKAKEKVLKKRAKKKDKKKQETKELTEAEVVQRNLAYFTRTAQPGKATELMLQVRFQQDNAFRYCPAAADRAKRRLT